MVNLRHENHPPRGRVRPSAAKLVVLWVRHTEGALMRPSLKLLVRILLMPSRRISCSIIRNEQPSWLLIKHGIVWTDQTSPYLHNGGNQGLLRLSKAVIGRSRSGQVGPGSNRIRFRRSQIGGAFSVRKVSPCTLQETLTLAETSFHNER
jgi:hypothetical protein